MRAMRIEGADPPLPVAEHDNRLAQELFLARHLVQLVERADRLPVAAHQLAHRAARLDAGGLVIRCGSLPSVGRFHRIPPLSHLQFHQAPVPVLALSERAIGAGGAPGVGHVASHGLTIARPQPVNPPKSRVAMLAPAASAVAAISASNFSIGLPAC